jgi:hypothetical protein
MGISFDGQVKKTLCEIGRRRGKAARSHCDQIFKVYRCACGTAVGMAGDLVSENRRMRAMQA